MTLESIFPVMKIGNLEIQVPIIQGGMGVRISRARLAAAVANQGGIGIIASVGLGMFEDYPNAKFSEVNEIALREEIRKAKSLTNGIVGVNIMVALSDYENLVKTSVEENVDVIISGAGLPLQLPGLVGDKDIKLVPVVSSGRTLKIICKKWQKQFNRMPDAVVVEGPMAGGHLGYTLEQLETGSAKLENILKEVVAVANDYTPQIPVIAAGGIFNGQDMADQLALGASGVQMGTRFVCTDECDVHENFKKLYLQASKEDITIIKSPVGMPGKVIRNEFVDKIKNGLTIPFKCKYKCLKSCNPQTAPYCIAEVLAKACQGKMDESFAFAGSNAWQCNEIVSVETLIKTIAQEYKDARK